MMRKDKQDHKYISYTSLLYRIQAWKRFQIEIFPNPVRRNFVTFAICNKVSESQKRGNEMRMGVSSLLKTKASQRLVRDAVTAGIFKKRPPCTKLLLLPMLKCPSMLFAPSLLKITGKLLGLMVC